MKSIIIAEAGVNHNGELKKAKRLVEIAANSGADFIKFQTFNADDLTTKFAPKAEYQILATRSNESQHEMLRKLELSQDIYLELIEYSKAQNIGIISTAFDIKSADMLKSLGQTIFKIPSGEITNLPYLRHVGSFQSSVILSTGMSNLDEIGSAIEVLCNAGTPKSRITVLQCTSAYPAPIQEVNLLAMLGIRDAFDVAVGYSDHTLGFEISLAAAALGATVIEKHFTIDRNLPGPDHRISLEPEELLTMVKQIRNIEIGLGDVTKRASLSELENVQIVRKSIVAKRAIKIGEVLTEENLTTKRPGTGISPIHWDRVVGSMARRDYGMDELID